MAETPPPPPNDRPRFVGVDSLWFDPFVINASSAIVITDVVVVNGVQKILLPANGRRFMLGIFPDGLGMVHKIGPWPDCGVFTFTSAGFNSSAVWYTLFNYGPMVCSQWNVLGNGNATLRCVEVLRS